MLVFLLWFGIEGPSCTIFLASTVEAAPSHTPVSERVTRIIARDMNNIVRNITNIQTEIQNRLLKQGKFNKF